MGGHIVTLVAERHPDLYHAVFTVGAALCPTKQVSKSSTINSFAIDCFVSIIMFCFCYSLPFSFFCILLTQFFSF